MMGRQTAWVDHMFMSMQARNGGVVRRAIRNVGDMDMVVAEAKRRGFHVILTSDQVLILCHEGDIRVLA